MLLLLLARVLRDPSLSSIPALLTVAGTRLHTVRAVLDKVVDIIVEIREVLPVVTSVAILLVQILLCTEPGC